MPSATCDGERVPYRVVVMGVSTGGVRALEEVLGALPAQFPLPILIVQHMGPSAGGGLALLLDHQCRIRVKEADEEELMMPGSVYLAPANYHLLVETDGSLSLSNDGPVNFARPSVDVLFESAAAAFGRGVIGVVLTGAGCDGGFGVRSIKHKGGLVVVQDPADAEAATMPEFALSLVAADHVVTLEELPGLLQKLAEEGHAPGGQSGGHGRVVAASDT